MEPVGLVFLFWFPQEGILGYKKLALSHRGVLPVFWTCATNDPTIRFISPCIFSQNYLSRQQVQNVNLRGDWNKV